MSMANPDTVPLTVLAVVLACSDCEADRRPRMYLCPFHTGWWAGWEARLEAEGGAE